MHILAGWLPDGMPFLCINTGRAGTKPDTVRDVKTGVSRSDAFRKMGLRVDEQSIKSLVSSIIQAEKMGMNIGPILRSQADQRRIERFQKAEKMAMEAPVKLLFPLVAFIFPCTFIVIGFPVYVLIKDAFL